MMNDLYEKDFQRKVANNQIFATSFATLGSVMIVVGIAISTGFFTSDVLAVPEEGFWKVLFAFFNLEFYTQGFLLLLGGLIGIALSILLPRYWNGKAYREYVEALNKK